MYRTGSLLAAKQSSNCSQEKRTRLIAMWHLFDNFQILYSNITTELNSYYVNYHKQRKWMFIH